MNTYLNGQSITNLRYKELAAAVCARAALDYQTGYQYFKSTGKKTYKYIENRVFFLSDLFKLYSHIDGQSIIDQIESLVDSGKSLKEQAKELGYSFF